METTLTPRQHRPFPDLKGALFLMLIGWGVGLPLAPLLSGYFDLSGITAIANIISLGIMATTGLYLARTPYAITLSIKPFSIVLLGPMVLMAFSGTLIVAELGAWSERLYPMPDDIRDLFMAILSANSPIEWLKRAGLLVILAPITEEIVFRGVFLHGMVKNYGPTKGIIFTGLCFGIFHLIPWQAVGAACVGILISFIVYRTASIFAGMIFHAIWNALPLIAITVMPKSALDSYINGQQPTAMPLSAVLLAILIFSLGCHQFWNKTQPKSPSIPSDPLMPDQPSHG